MVRQARRAGVLWVAAAGNEAEKHWSGTFLDSDGDNWHEFAGKDEDNDVSRQVEPRDYVCPVLKWDDWPRSRQDYDVYLVSAQGATLAASRNLQSGRQPPSEIACYTNRTRSPQKVAVRIRRERATGTPRLDLVFEGGGRFEHAVSAGSVGEPASSPAVMAVGAVCWRDDSLEPFSSRGPTIDGRLKPDIAAPDSVSSRAYGRFSRCAAHPGFPGTSASTPHVAGAAALLKQANRALRPDALQELLEADALDLGPAGKDNDYGAGKLSLKSAP